jgi:adenylosuccinate lyase
MKSWEEDGDFRAAIAADPEVQACLSPEQLEKSFALDRQLANVDKIFARVFGG